MSEKDPFIRALYPLLRRVRTDVSAVKKRDGTAAWTREPLTKVSIGKHLNGGPPRGASFIKAGQSVTLVGALDLDSHGGETPWETMAGYARQIVAMGDVMFGLRGVPWRSSGGRGIHIYFLFDEPQDAYSLRMTLCELLGVCGLANGTKGVAQGQAEVFPKQDSVPLDGFGNMMILPLAGQSAPLHPVSMNVQPRDAALTLAWPVSEPVPLRTDSPARATVTGTAEVPLALVRSALLAIPNVGDAAPDYDLWRDLVFAVHHATGGSDDGLDLVIEWSAQNDRHDEGFLRSRVWPYIKTEKAGGKTWRTLAMHARRCGWAEPAELWFDDLDGEDDAPENDVVGAAAPTVQGVARGQPPDEHLASPPGAGASSALPDEAPVVDGATAETSAPDDRRRAGDDGVRGRASVLKPRAWPALTRHPKTGEIERSVNNVRALIERSDITGWRIAYDAFRDEIMRAADLTDEWVSFADEDYLWLRQRLEQIGVPDVGREFMRDVVYAVAKGNEFDSAKLWLDSLTHDGTARVERFLIDYWGVEDTPYSRAVSLYIWTALAGRVMEPGCKADMVPIAIGEQGARKSSSVAAMVPGPEFFSEISFTERDDDLSRKMRGKLIAEIAELRGLHTKDREAILAFVTRTHEQWVPKFKEFATQFPRRLLFFGTTNHVQFLDDATGYRRWLPFETGRVDAAGIARDREQLWAEAQQWWETFGVMWQDAEQLARAQHARHEMEDPWTQRVAMWLSQPTFADGPLPSSLPFLTTSQVLTEALNMETQKVRRTDEMRAGTVLRAIGYATRERVRVNGIQTTGYFQSRRAYLRYLAEQGMHT